MSMFSLSYPSKLFQFRADHPSPLLTPFSPPIRFVWSSTSILSHMRSNIANRGFLLREPLCSIINRILIVFKRFLSDQSSIWFWDLKVRNTVSSHVFMRVEGSDAVPHHWAMLLRQCPSTQATWCSPKLDVGGVSFHPSYKKVYCASPLIIIAQLFPCCCYLLSSS